MEKKARIKTTVKSDSQDTAELSRPQHMFKLLISSPGKTLIREIGPGETLVIGRDSGCELCIDDPLISRTHASMEEHDGKVLIEDKGSMNGVRIGGKRISGRSRVMPGQEIMIGNTLMVLVETSDISAAEKSKFPFSELEQDGDEHQEEKDVIIEDEVMKNVYRMAGKAASTDVPVLIVGETGVGKEILARYIHRHSRYGASPMVKVFCPAFPETLIESELFGYEKGAFTGAANRKTGLFESAGGGTLFLDEITDIPNSFQTKLLRFLDDRKITRLGGNEEIRIDTRIIAATNRDPEQEAKAGSFRMDLYYRLSTVQLFIPPLRNRRSEIIPLAGLFARRAAARFKKAFPVIDNSLKMALLAYAWPGNVRQLKSVIEKAVILSDEAVLTAAHLKSIIRENQRSVSKAYTVFKERKEEAERNAILDALESCGWNQTRAAILLGLSRRSVVYKIKKYNLKKAYH